MQQIIGSRYFKKFNELLGFINFFVKDLIILRYLIFSINWRTMVIYQNLAFDFFSYNHDYQFDTQLDTQWGLMQIVILTHFDMDLIPTIG
jgi:hypothetical protein